MPCQATDWCKDLSVLNHKFFARYEGYKEFCVFHAPRGEKGISVEEFNELIFKRINEAKQKKERCDLSKTVFEGSISFEQFNKDNPLLDINFSGARFSEDADFSKVTFAGKIHFGFCDFIGDSSFKEATFNEKADFSSAFFNKNADFSRAIFNDKLFFSGSLSQAVFSGATFAQATVFRRTCFSEGLRELNIKDKIILENIDLTEVSFIDTDLRRIDFINCTWPEKDGRQVLYDELSAYTKQDWPDFKDDIKKVEILYRQLKQKCKEDHNEYEVSNWHYGEKEMQRKGSSWKDFSFYLLNLYWVSSGYGENPVRAIVVLFFLIIYASWLLAIAGLTVPYDTINGIDKSIYGITNIIWPYNFNFEKVWALLLNILKYVTFQKDYFFKPINWFGETVKILAQILIPLQTALFALAVRNRFRR